MKKVIVFMKKMYHSFQKKAKKQPKARRAQTAYTPCERTAGDTDVLWRMEAFLEKQYDFRYNRLSDATEYRPKEPDGVFHVVGPRELNGLCIEARKNGVECWDRDVSRYVNSFMIKSFHPLTDYLDKLPPWDGADRMEALARRVSAQPVWINGFHLWMRALAAQWLGAEGLHGNSVAPVLVSRRQGMHKSTFCRMLLPGELQGYYTDSFDLASLPSAEKKLAAFGLINLDELDKYSDRKMALLKSLMQTAALNIRKAHRNHFSALPRTASFIATSNRRELLADPTGSRRFLCVEVAGKIDCSPIDHAQVYAQLKAELATGARHWFTTAEETELMAHNEPFRKKAVEEDLFHHCFRLPADDEDAPAHSAAYLFAELKKRYPAAMRHTTLGADRIHTRQGNRYRVVTL